jgi:hypothetical protein
MGRFIGPDASAEIPHLEMVWHAEGDRLLASWHQTTPAARAGLRPWAFWRFEVGEDPPEETKAEALRLAQLGLLTDDEHDVLRSRAEAAQQRISTDAQQIGADFYKDRMDAELWDAVLAADP